LYGYDSEDRLAHWIELLRLAAQGVSSPPATVPDRLRQGLETIYRRLVDRVGVLRFHPGVARWTVEQMRPELRAALDRRITASASLIRLNRQEAVEATLRRFSGWATSVPAGGSEAPQRQAAKAATKKALAQQRFVERRVEIDQGHKLVASISEIVAVGANAIAVRWNSHWRQAGYDYREDHKERDGHVYAIRDNWAIKRGFMAKGGEPYYDEITGFGVEVYCLPGDTVIPFADGVEKAYRRMYSGDLVSITTATGRSLRATPNHPVLTPKGWVPIGALNKGDSVAEVIDKSMLRSKADDDNAIPVISEIFSALNGLGISEVAVGKAAQFHGDGTACDVDIVSSTRPLYFGRKVYGLQSVGNFDFTESEYPLSMQSTEGFGFRSIFDSPSGFLGRLSYLLSSIYSHLRHASHHLIRSYVAHGFVSVLRDLFALSFAHFCVADAAGFFEGPHLNSSVLKSAEDSYLRDTEHSSDFNRAFSPSSVKTYDRTCWHFVELRSANRTAYSGHVYNLQTRNGYYIANGIITHNCRCYGTYIYALRNLPSGMLTVKGREALDRVRAA